MLVKLLASALQKRRPKYSRGAMILGVTIAASMGSWGQANSGALLDQADPLATSNGRLNAPTGSAMDPALPSRTSVGKPGGQPAGKLNPEAQQGGFRTQKDPTTRRSQQSPRPQPTSQQERTSEFQRFVATAVGRVLPVFGEDFFSSAADSFAPVDNVPVGADYIVGPGDEILVRAWGSIDLDYRATVDRNGLLNLPKVGSFRIAGVKASELESQLRSQIGRLFTNFNLNVTMGQLRGVKVFVVGPAVKPGVYTLASQSTLLSAVVAAGGPAVNGSMRKISLRRNGAIISTLDVYDFLVQGDNSRDTQLAGGDVVVFHPVGARVALTGATDSAAIFELSAMQAPLGDLLRYAGATSILANRSRVHLERIDPNAPTAKRFVEEFVLDNEGLAKPLRDGDILALLAISPKFANAVTLKGHVAQPIRSAWRPGMRIRDLIPDVEALITPSFYEKQNLLVQRPEKDVGANAANPSVELAALFDQLNWDYAVIERLSATDLSTVVIPFNLGGAILRGESEHNLELLPGDVVTVYSHKDIRVPVAKQTRLVSLQGEVAAPGVYQLQPGETLRGLITRAGGFTSQAYLYGLDLSREETRRRQRENIAAATARLEALAATQAARASANRRDDVSAAADTAVSNAATQAQISRLSRIEPNGRIALELEPAIQSINDIPDVPLENSDRIVVPTRPGFVTVAGAVVNSNAFLWKSGRTAGDYVKLAGLDEGAEVAGMFILRADGTVTHAADSKTFLGLGNTLQSEVLFPGDAVIVPNQLDFETWGRALVRNLKDWSQILANFGLSAAAINSLKN
jgi:polysaccharide biosynthesis/export protein